MTRNTYRFSIVLLCGVLFFQILSISAYADPTSGQLRLIQYTNEIWQTGKLKRWKVHAYGQAGDVYLSFTIMKKS